MEYSLELIWYNWCDFYSLILNNMIDFCGFVVIIIISWVLNFFLLFCSILCSLLGWILTDTAIPQVHVTPRIQSRRPGEDSLMKCHAVGVPFPKVRAHQSNQLQCDKPNLCVCVCVCVFILTTAATLSTTSLSPVKKVWMLNFRPFFFIFLWFLIEEECISMFIVIHNLFLCVCVQWSNGMSWIGSCNIAVKLIGVFLFWSSYFVRNLCSLLISKKEEKGVT